MYVRRYAVWSGGSCGPVDYFFNSGGGILPMGRGHLGLTYRKNVHCGVDVAYPWLSDWTHLQWALLS